MPRYVLVIIWQIVFRPSPFSTPSFLDTKGPKQASAVPSFFHLVLLRHLQRLPLLLARCRQAERKEWWACSVLLWLKERKTTLFAPKSYRLEPFTTKSQDNFVTPIARNWRYRYIPRSTLLMCCFLSSLLCLFAPHLFHVSCTRPHSIQTFFSNFLSDIFEADFKSASITFSLVR